MEDHPEKCTKCGIDLVKAKNVTKTDCPMCKEKTTMKDGKCIKCGKQITEYEENGLSKKEYVCICWQDESKTTGKCSKCGAKMEEMK